MERSVDSGFPAAMLRDLQQHAEGCSSCAQHLEAMQGAVTRLREDVSAEPPPDMETDVMERIGASPIGPPGALPMPSGAILPVAVPDLSWVGAWKVLAGIVIGSAMGAVVVTAF